MAWRWSLRSVFMASRARHRSALPMVAAALAKALVALCRAPSTLAAPAVASSRVSRSGCRRAAVLSGVYLNGLNGEEDPPYQDSNEC